MLKPPATSVTLDTNYFFKKDLFQSLVNKTSLSIPKNLSQEQIYYKENVLSKAFHSLTHTDIIYEQLLQHLKPPVDVKFFNDILKKNYKNLEEVKNSMGTHEKTFLKTYLGHETLYLLLNYETILDKYTHLKSTPYIQKNEQRSIKHFETKQNLPDDLIVENLQKFGFKSIQCSHYMDQTYVNSFLNCLYEELEEFNQVVQLNEKLCNFNLVLCNKSPVGESCFDLKSNIMYIEDLSYGTFIHEWFHYFDWNSDHDKYLSYQFIEELKNYPNLVNTSEKKDNELNLNYFTQPHELWARNFETWMSLKLKNSQIILGSHMTNNKLYAQEEEQEKLNIWFSENWLALKSKYLHNNFQVENLLKNKKGLKYN